LAQLTSDYVIAEVVESLIRISEAARLLDVSAQTVRNYTKLGRLRCFKSRSGERLYSPKEVLSFRLRRDEERDAIASIREHFRSEMPDHSMAL
jgi:DNA-binding transcriptional MerR regulator